MQNATKWSSTKLPRTQKLICMCAAIGKEKVNAGLGIPDSEAVVVGFDEAFADGRPRIMLAIMGVRRPIISSLS